METKDVILELRTKKGLSQDELAGKVMVTRQAVSRWENGETVPNTETLKLLSKEFGVSINTLLGAPRKLICQCCGMPLEDDEIISHDSDGTLNEDYCKWCYADGTYTYSNMDDLIDVCVKNMINENFTEEQVRAYMKDLLPKLDYVMKDLVKKANLESSFYIDSAGTSNEEDGNPVHYGTQNKLREEGIPCGNHRARQMTKKDYEEFDYLIGMEQWNIRNINRIIRKDPEHKVHLLLEYAGEARDIADPWYTGNFDVTYEDVKEGCEAFLQYLIENEPLY